jgi:hypothetical protein
MLFTTAAYGKKYLPFLYTFLYSLEKTHPEDDILVMWDDMPDFEIHILSERFSKVEFKKVNHNIIHQDIMQRIPLKLRYWADVLRETRHENICFLDSDTVVYKNISEFVQDDFDFLYTWKNESIPLNVGVVIVKNSEKTLKFIEKWLEITEQIVMDKQRLDKAVLEHGAADQSALAELMELKNYDGINVKNYDFGEITLKGVSCDILNQTNSRPLDCGSYIFHYKAGWHPILLEKSGFTAARTEESSYQMLKYWENIYYDINEQIIQKFIMSSASKQEKILAWENLEFEERGILHSEMLAIISVIKESGAEVIIESGRCRGQSTFTLAKAFENKDILIVSIEWIRDENADFAENRLKGFKNLELLYGDANILIPEIIERFKEKKIAILFDGPKGADAYRIFARVSAKNSDIIMGFFHDCKKSHKKYLNPSRDDIHKFFDRVWFSDDEKYVEAFKYIDKLCIGSENSITPNTWRPYHTGWFDKIESYGPTVSIVFPSARDVVNSQANFGFAGLDPFKSTVNIKKLTEFISNYQNKKICFWGAGLMAVEFASNVHLKSLNILGFIDKDPFKKGKKIKDYTIYSPEDLEKLNPDILVFTFKPNERTRADIEDFIKEKEFNFEIIPDLFDF